MFFFFTTFSSFLTSSFLLPTTSSMSPYLSFLSPSLLLTSPSPPVFLPSPLTSLLLVSSVPSPYFHHPHPWEMSLELLFQGLNLLNIFGSHDKFLKKERSWHLSLYLWFLIDFSLPTCLGEVVAQWWHMGDTVTNVGMSEWMMDRREDAKSPAWVVLTLGLTWQFVPSTHLWLEKALNSTATNLLFYSFFED